MNTSSSLRMKSRRMPTSFLRTTATIACERFRARCAVEFYDRVQAGATRNFLPNGRRRHRLRRQCQCDDAEGAAAGERAPTPGGLPDPPRKSFHVCSVAQSGWRIAKCGAIAGGSALYLAFDGALLGTKTLQYQIQRGDGMMLILTATSTENNMPRMLGEFEVMVSSIRVR